MTKEPTKNPSNAPGAPAADMAFCFVQMQGNLLKEASLLRLSDNKPLLNLDLDGAKATSTTVTGAGTKPENTFEIKFTDRHPDSCKVGGDTFPAFTRK